MKIEMGWMNFLHSQRHYLELDKSVIGTERYYKNELSNLKFSTYKEIQEQIVELSKHNLKMAKTVSEYFENKLEMVMAESLANGWA